MVGILIQATISLPYEGIFRNEYFDLFRAPLRLSRPASAAVRNRSYHIISYHIISYHIISYHIISEQDDTEGEPKAEVEAEAEAEMKGI